MIQYFFENTDEISISEKTNEWIASIIVSEEKRMGTINYIFCDDAYLLKVNQDYLQHDYYTDIITFDYVKGKTISSDIFISLQRVLDNAQLHQKDFENELYRVLAHGILHLCGYMDKPEEEIKIMREKEDYYLTTIQTKK
jgi:rRNA maturation RNase YbeY